jgi:hypothetical protein
MALHTDTTARTRLATYEKNICPQCSAWLLAPDWSEHLTERFRHTWSCETCGYGFETAVFFPAVVKDRRVAAPQPRKHGRDQRRGG